MTEYLITLQSSRYRLLRAHKQIMCGDPESAREQARQWLAHYRARFIGGDDWDEWVLSVRGNGAYTAPIVARGTAKDL